MRSRIRYPSPVEGTLLSAAFSASEGAGSVGVEDGCSCSCVPRLPGLCVGGHSCWSVGWERRRELEPAVSLGMSVPIFTELDIGGTPITI